MATLVQLRTRVANLLAVFPLNNSPTAYPTTQGAGGRVGYASDKIDDVITDVSAAIIGLIAANPDNPRRRGLTTTVSQTNGALIPDHVGPIGAVIVDGKPGVLTGARDVQRINDNALAYTAYNTGYYGKFGERIWFAGTTCTVDIVALATVDVTVVPPEYLDALVNWAVAKLLMLAGDAEMVASATQYANMALESLKILLPPGQPLPVIMDAVMIYGH